MLIIPQCRFCNQETKTCAIRSDLKARLQKGGVNENVRYECGKWKDYYLYKRFETIQFRFLSRTDDPDSRDGWVLSEKVITGQVIDHTSRRPIYIVQIDQEQMDLIESTHSPYAYQAQAILGPYPDEKPTGFYLIPVREQFVINKATGSVPIP